MFPQPPTPNVSEANGTVAQKQMAKFTKSFRNSGGKGAWCAFSKPVWSALLLLAVKALGSDASTDQRSGKATKRPGCREVGTSTLQKSHEFLGLDSGCDTFSSLLIFTT